MTRRDALLLAAATLLPGLAAATTEVAPGVHVRRGETADATRGNADGIANTGFIVGRESVAVIDPGGSRADGEALRAAIRDVTTLPVSYVLYTHMHPDHVFGAGAFASDQPRVVANENMPAQLLARGGYDHRRLVEILGDDAAVGMPVPPTVLVSDAFVFDLGDRVVRAGARPTAHTNTDLIVFDETTRTLWTGDLVFLERVPSLDGSLRGWLKVLSELELVPAAIAVPGHGPVSAPWPAAAEPTRRYLSTLARDIRAIIAKGGDIETAVRTAAASERGEWALFDDYNGRNATTAFKELEWE